MGKILDPDYRPIGVERLSGTRVCTQLSVRKRTLAKGLYASVAATVFERRSHRIFVVGDRIQRANV